MTADDYAIGVDLGGTKIEVALVDGRGEIKTKTRVPTPTTGGAAAVVDEIVGAVRSLQQETGIHPLGLGIGVAGQIGASGELVRFAPNLNWHDVPLRDELQRHLELSVVVLNDVRAATWAEWRYGAGRGCTDLICLFVGTGIGGSTVNGGRMLEGHGNCAGELGHWTIDLNGPLCHCGNRGCLEALAGGWAIGRRARAAVAADPIAGRLLQQLATAAQTEISAELVAQAAHAGDPLASQLVAEVAEALCAGAVGLVNAFNPERLILGGGVIEGLPELVERIAAGVRQRALQAATEQLRVIPAELHNDAGVIGAAAFAMDRFSRTGRPL